MKKFNKQYGPWALVTGASSGIGAEFAKKLAEKGLNLVLVARRKEILELKSTQLKKRYGIEVMPIELDLTQEGAVEKLAKMIKKLDIGLVVPNAGMITYGSFIKTSLEEQEKLLKLNAIVPMQMTHIFGERLAKRGKGGIILLSSTFAYQAVPYFANYAASKSYILYLAEALHYELSDKGVKVLALSPGLTDTEMPSKIPMDFSKMPMKIMKPEAVVKTAMKGLCHNKSSIVAGGMNKMMAAMSQRMMRRAGVASMFGGMNKKAMDSAYLQMTIKTVTLFVKGDEHA